MTEKAIPAHSLVPMAIFSGDVPLRTALAYARADNLAFGEVIYRPGAQLYLHEDLARIVLLASRLLPENLRMVLYDGLRTTDAQARMLETQRVKDNPHWLEEPRLLSPPGAGGHPRGMAIDISLETLDGALLDMGTAFDFFAEDPSPQGNPAHREHVHSEDIMQNRRILDSAMGQAAGKLGLELFPLPQEWWDFRLTPDTVNRYAPLSDSDLPPQMRLVRADETARPPDFDESHFEKIKERLLAETEMHLR